jgi:hypothetical protein
LLQTGETKRLIRTRSRQRRLSFEVLEDRTAPALFSWTDADHNEILEDPQNWDQNGALPTINDDLYIGTGGTLVNQQGAISKARSARTRSCVGPISRFMIR